MVQKKINEAPRQVDWEEEEKTPQALFPDIYNIINLKIDQHLPIVRLLNFNRDSSTNQHNISIKVDFPGQRMNSDLFIFVNGEKRDMYYQVQKGIYEFKKLKLKGGANEIDVFYRTGSRRSVSVTSVINKI